MKNITKIGLSIISFFIFTIPAFADCTVTASPQNIAVDHTTNVTYVMTVSSYPFNYFGVNGVGTWGSQFGIRWRGLYRRFGSYIFCSKRIRKLSDNDG